MNNIEAAIMNVDVIKITLEEGWTKPRSEKEQDILGRLKATAIQLQDVQEEISIKLDTMRRLQ